MSLNYSGYSDWEISILDKLFNDGGEEGKQSARYIVENNIHIKVGEPFEYRNPLSPRFLKGDWESLFSVGAWWKGKKLVVLNPNSGYTMKKRPKLWGISLVAHEAKHISQGLRAWTKRGEMEAWKFGLTIYENMGGTIDSPRDTGVRDAQTLDEFVKAIRTHDPKYWKGLRLLPPWAR